MSCLWAGVTCESRHWDDVGACREFETNLPHGTPRTTGSQVRGILRKFRWTCGFSQTHKMSDTIIASGFKSITFITSSLSVLCPSLSPSNTNCVRSAFCNIVNVVIYATFIQEISPEVLWPLISIEKTTAAENGLQNRGMRSRKSSCRRLHGSQLQNETSIWLQWFCVLSVTGLWNSVLSVLWFLKVRYKFKARLFELSDPL